MTSADDNQRPDLTRLAPPQGAKIAVAGGCGGIGRAVVQGLLANGCDVAVFDLAGSLERHPPPPETVTAAFDVHEPDSVDAAFESLAERWDGIEGCVILPGYAADLIPAAELALETYDDIMNANARGTFLCARAAIPLLRRSTGRAAMVLMSSGLGNAGRPGYSAYAASKAATASLTRTLAAELAPQIRVNAVSPGGVDTAFLRGGTGRSDENRPMRISSADYAKLVPLGRLAMPEEIAGPILFLLSTAAAHITGQALHINGGALMRD